MSKQQICASLIKKQKEFITKSKSKSEKIKNIEHIATSIDGSFIHLRTKRGISVSAYIRPILVNIDELLESGTDKQDYRFEGIDSEKLREKFINATQEIIPISPIKYASLKDNVHLYIYSIGNKRRIYNIVEALNTEHTF